MNEWDEWLYNQNESCEMISFQALVESEAGIEFKVENGKIYSREVEE